MRERFISQDRAEQLIADIINRGGTTGEILTEIHYMEAADVLTPEEADAMAAMEPNFGYSRRKAVYDKAIGRWGSWPQVWMVIEEMSELTKAICKVRRKMETDYTAAVMDVAEEAADVTIMLEQLQIIFNIREEVEEIRDQKIMRLKERLDQHRAGDFSERYAKE